MLYRLMILFIAGMLIASCSVISGNDNESETILKRLDLNPVEVSAKSDIKQS